MSELNREAGRVFRRAGVRACTDVTGFGLLGHALELASKGAVGLRIRLSRLPIMEGAKEYAEMSLFPAGTYANLSCYECRVEFEEGLEEEMRLLLFSPETSGGLLGAVAPEAVDSIESALREAGVSYRIVGEVVEGTGIEVVEK